MERDHVFFPSITLLIFWLAPCILSAVNSKYIFHLLFVLHFLVGKRMRHCTTLCNPQLGKSRETWVLFVSSWHKVTKRGVKGLLCSEWCQIWIKLMNSSDIQRHACMYVYKQILIACIPTSVDAKENSNTILFWSHASTEIWKRPLLLSMLMILRLTPPS